MSSASSFNCRVVDPAVRTGCTLQLVGGFESELLLVDQALLFAAT